MRNTEKEMLETDIKLQFLGFSIWFYRLISLFWVVNLEFLEGQYDLIGMVYIIITRTLDLNVFVMRT